MSNRYKEELPPDITEREMRDDMLANQTIFRAMPVIGGGVAVAFMLESIIATGHVLLGVLTAAACFVGGFLAFGLTALLVFYFRHFNVHPAAIYVFSALAPVFLSLLFMLAPSEDASDPDLTYEDGKASGYEAGYTVGYTNGQKSGYEEGNAAGYRAGMSSGYESGVAAGKKVGYDNGYEEAKLEYITPYLPTGTKIVHPEMQPIYYATPWGEHYHTKTCSYVTTPMPIRLINASRAGYTPCEHCLPSLSIQKP